MIPITAAGTVGQDAELKFSASGTEVLSFSVACRTGFDKQKNESKTTWVRCTMFGARAASAEAHLKKGTKVTVSGTVNEVRAYTNKDGTPGASLEVNVNDYALQGSKPAVDPFD